MCIIDNCAPQQAKKTFEGVSKSPVVDNDQKQLGLFDEIIIQ